MTRPYAVREVELPAAIWLARRYPAREASPPEDSPSLALHYRFHRPGEALPPHQIAEKIQSVGGLRWREQASSRMT